MIQCAGGKGNGNNNGIADDKAAHRPIFQFHTFANTMTKLSNKQKIVKFVKNICLQTMLLMNDALLFFKWIFLR